MGIMFLARSRRLVVGVGGRQCHNDESYTTPAALSQWLSPPVIIRLSTTHPTSMFSLRPLHRAAPSPLRLCNSCLRKYSVAPPPKQQNAQKQVIFSGIQPTGIPHLGNYLGALRQWVRLQDEASPDTTLLFSIVDLHAITIKQDPSELAAWGKEMLASLLAVGLDPKRCIIFSQSSVKQHAELMWILSCGASMGYLGRMTQWKVCDRECQCEVEEAALTMSAEQIVSPGQCLPSRPLE